MSHKNVDIREIEKFSALAKQWWDPHGKMGMLHTINPLRLKVIEDAVPLKGKKALDVGCGGGILTEEMARSGAVALGIDLAEKPLEVAKLHAKEQSVKVDYRLTNIEAMLEASEGKIEKFDVVVCMEMLEHVPHPDQVINACAQLLKPGGHVFFSTINRTIKAFICAILGAEYILRIMPKRTHKYSMLLRPEEIEKWAMDSGLSLEKTSSFIYNPFTKTFKLREGADINYVMHFTKK
ncbi:uncharacterized protein LOC111320093 [Stylophora pistillata]|uniref:uncharacterized protein LOC111320093 n=1 Tax=Stylophora pistillata TaxID=50429 RepID=UPI000C049BAC|nr:uncharacterized protein LOC111320093 [Stylophora pistillata]